MQPFAEACMASPIGAALLAQLEWRQRRDYTRLVDDPSSDPAHVDSAVQRVLGMTFGDLCVHALRASENVGPWLSDADLEAWAAYLHVAERRPIAEAIASRFDAELHAPIALDSQQWWLHSRGAAGVSPLFVNLDHRYDNGELSWGALRAYGQTPTELLDERVGEAPTPHTRWALPVAERPRVFEINRPADWHELCTRFPHVAKGRHGTWALPGVRHNISEDLLRLDHQHAAARTVDVHLCPTWSMVARDYDAVHLSWAGFITAEGHVFTQGRNTTMLRYWDREVTMWLKDCFGEPAPLPLDQDAAYVMDPTTSPGRLAQDQQTIAALLARN